MCKGPEAGKDITSEEDRKKPVWLQRRDQKGEWFLMEVAWWGDPPAEGLETLPRSLVFIGRAVGSLSMVLKRDRT